MRYLSVCSGVEAASVAWEHLGWTPVGFSEIEPFPSAVLKHRFPNVPNFGDMTKYKEWPIEPGTVDVLVGGTPCQSFSVAGLRKGLDDPRGNLMLVYLGLAEHFRVPWLVWENVPGVLSSNGGRDFGTFLGALGELGYRWSFRVLDAQYFGVPQRRRRVFVIAHLGDGPHPSKVLFEPESLRGDSAPRRKAREGSARGARPGAESGGRPGPFWNGADVAEALTRTSDDQRMPDKGRMQVVVTATGPVTHALTRSQKGATEDGTDRGTPIVPVSMRESGPGYWLEDTVSGTIDASMGKSGHGNRAATIAFHPTQDPISSVEVTHAKTRPTDGSEGGTGSRQGTATVAVAIPIISDADRAESSAQTPSPDAEGRIRLRDPGLGIGNDGDPMFTLQATKPHAIAFTAGNLARGAGPAPSETTVGTLLSQNGRTRTDQDPLVATVAIPILEAGKRVGVSQTDPRAGIGIGQEGDPMYTLQASAQHAVATAYAVHGEHSTAMQSSNPATLVARPVEVARCLDTTGGYATSQGGTVVGQEITGTLSSRATAGGGLGTDFEVAGGLQAVDVYNGRITGETTATITKAMSQVNASGAQVMLPTMAVRRLLPVECERLQGFKDDHTLIPWKGKPASECPDGPRYKAMGNSMAVPVMRWIGERFDRVVRGEL